MGLADGIEGIGDLLLELDTLLGFFSCLVDSPVDRFVGNVRVDVVSIGIGGGVCRVDERFALFSVHEPRIVLFTPHIYPFGPDITCLHAPVFPLLGIHLSLFQLLLPLHAPVVHYYAHPSSSFPFL